jgi:hypothetical protein
LNFTIPTEYQECTIPVDAKRIMFLSLILITSINTVSNINIFVHDQVTTFNHELQ